jgi:hypothetical protein
MNGSRASRMKLVWALLFLLASAAVSMGQAQPVTTAAELLTSTQHLWVNVRTVAQGVKIYIDQIEAADTKALNLPEGFTAVANIQIFDQSRLNKIVMHNGTDTQYANAIAKVPRDSNTEIVSFDPPMIILLGNPAGVTTQITRIGLLLGKGTEKNWVVWDANASDEEKAAVLAKLKSAGFVVEFYKGEPAKLLVSEWPSGDPCVGH